MLQEIAADPDPDTFKPIATSPTSPTSPFDSSLALTILILLIIFFFLTFFSLYFRRFSSHPRNNHSPPHFQARKRHGLDISTVRSLPIVTYGQDDKTWTECSICLSEFEAGDTVKVIPNCGHGFHPTCIDTWLTSNVSCPVCRSTEMFLAVDV
ncbi:Zinc finger, RING/FYVE/PHD-type [Artemisia annua]|uniref:RING-type E3 ubiquitin transferase n=1 Tax=Artemisia annua TaxID=35608 RepID=A0A2U1P356_ARTAN|nr:Zinc finger, RING/FYVE/PHD-type [Artemisia annua]